MIYHLFEYLQEIGCDFPGIGLVKYITFRAMMAIMTALAVALYFGPKIIRKLQKLQIGEEIRDLGLEGQMAKKGTPTMGGIIILLSILIPTFLPRMRCIAHHIRLYPLFDAHSALVLVLSRLWEYL